MFPTLSKAIDYEVELTIVISKLGRNISKADAYDHIFGYTILNDITARDIQRRHGGQYFRGKGLDGSCPIGPWIVTAD
jgi:2-keto-4-pentenoate hydratase/2-oxohepta-3-ene-1,7-dioic acid hydratase in catechol pathway